MLKIGFAKHVLKIYAAFMVDEISAHVAIDGVQIAVVHEVIEVPDEVMILAKNKQRAQTLTLFAGGRL